MKLKSGSLKRSSRLKNLQLDRLEQIEKTQVTKIKSESVNITIVFTEIKRIRIL